MLRQLIFTVALSTGVIAVHAESAPLSATDAVYTHQIEKWRQRRVARLTAPDGWLSLIGLEWLSPGNNRIGSAADNDIVLKAGPAHLGVITLHDHGSMHLQLAAGSGAKVDDKKVDSAELSDDMHVPEGRTPTTVTFGNASFYVIDRDGRKGLRVKDADAPTRRHFLGIDYFPIDASWHIEAEWVPFTPQHTLEMGNVLGSIDKVAVPGKAVFHRDGHTYELLPYQEEPGGPLFFVMADRTSGKQTYGAARFLYAALPAGGVTHAGKVTLDFNEAYNPPCAFTAFATCPLAPPENRLNLSVTAGEKKYAGGHH